MDELLKQVSDQTGIPVDMLERAAAARADATATTTEAVVAGWAGAPVPSGDAAPATPAAADTSAAPAPVAPAAVSAPATPAVPSLGVEVLQPAAPEPEVPAEDLTPEPEPAPVGPSLPRWLNAAFVIVPFIAILYALSVPNGPDCGNSGRLGIDPVTGEAVNCDGTDYGSEEVNFFSLGQAVYDTTCTFCHGSTGGGISAPALAGGTVLATFSECSDHIEWVTLGSDGWPESTYGDTNKPVSGGMPTFGRSLEDQDLRAAVLYERVAFGGEDVEVAEAGCGFTTAEALATP